MSETVRCSVSSGLNVTEVADAADFPGAEDAAGRTSQHNAYDAADTLVTGSAPDPEAVFSATYTGNATIDLQAAPKNGGGTQDLTGKKLIAYQLEAPAANAGDVTIAEGATNGYDMGGDLTLSPGETITRSFRSGSTTTFDDVAAADSEIDIVAGSDDLNVTMVFGDT